MTERNVDAGFREPVAAVLGPLDEGDRAVEVRLEVAPFLRVETGDAVQVEVRDGHARLVAMADREGRAGNGLTDAESPRGTSHERGLPGPRSPETATMSPIDNWVASSAAKASVSSG